MSYIVNNKKNNIMTLICPCPPPAAIETIPSLECEKRIGQIQKIVFQRRFSSGTTENTFAASGAGAADLLASWTPLLTAADSTKAVTTPFIANPEMTPGEARTTGGGNASVGGVTKILGANPTTFSGLIENAPQDIIKAIKQLQCEAKTIQNLSVFLINENGLIIANSDDGASPTEVKGFPIDSLFVGDLVAGGFDGQDNNAINFSMQDGWSDNLVFVQPTDFNAKTDLNV